MPDYHYIQTAVYRALRSAGLDVTEVVAGPTPPSSPTLSRRAREASTSPTPQRHFNGHRIQIETVAGFDQWSFFTAPQEDRSDLHLNFTVAALVEKALVTFRV